MPKATSKVRKRKRKPLLPIPLWELPGKGKIDPKQIRQAVIKVHGEMMKELAEAKAEARADAKRAKAEANGATQTGEGE